LDKQAVAVAGQVREAEAKKLVNEPSLERISETN
jgi:hypothetical protein